MRSYEDGSFIAATFDLQSVLQHPCSEASPMYHKRKLVVYNLTVYEYTSLNGHCYVWNEVNGNRGSCEIGIILLSYLRSLPNHITEVSLTSDSRGGQNRNQFIATAIFFAVIVLQIRTITFNFLEKGHTEMEWDLRRNTRRYLIWKNGRR